VTTATGICSEGRDHLVMGQRKGVRDRDSKKGIKRKGELASIHLSEGGDIKFLLDLQGKKGKCCMNWETKKSVSRQLGLNDHGAYESTNLLLR